ncbi:acetyltransferase [Microbacterium sp. Sa4CUA7]|uniref:Acetyltransferase n=1 Tax=Microbacterium pullorum TaxID=2762236 RepID=A0ABR8S5S2_9MICO|nr:acyltransferase family protein [Microbacterium pullorum]MBD7958827.1 acetyltransferase [Microbacterium pullorum]
MNAPTTSRAPHFAGLDGLRAIAVTLVVVYHLFPAWGLTSGFLGVDVFFVISGFLITSLLLREHTATGRIRLTDFWRRRARRLLPALALVVTVCATAAWLVGADLLVGIGGQIAGAATFSYNWVSIATGGDYFATTAPELFRNLWSLAVEEQFYLLWPLVLSLFLRARRRVVRVTAALVLAAASIVWAVALTLGGGDATRVYFGTDTHAFGLLLGVALAFAAQRAMPSWLTRRASPAVTGVAGVVAVAGMVGSAFLPPLAGAATYPGVLVVASVLTVIAIACGIVPHSWFGRALDAAPLRWVGVRSYGIYLWHWPVVVLLTHAATGGAPDAATPLWIGALALAISLAAAAASYRWVEMPIRRHGLVGSLRALRGGVSGSPQRRFGAAAAVLVGALALGGTTAAVASAPDETTAAAAVEAGRKALEEAGEAGAGEGPGAADGAAADAAEGTDDAPPSITGDQITAVGDSVMLASAPALLARYPGIAIDAAVSRSMWSAPDILRDLAAHDALRPVVVVGLGTNGAVSRAALREITRIVGSDRQLVLVDAHAPREWIDDVNSDLRDFARGRGNVAVADWSGAIAGRTDLLAGDGVHPGPTAAQVYADAVAQTIDHLNAGHDAYRERVAKREHAPGPRQYMSPE